MTRKELAQKAVAPQIWQKPERGNHRQSLKGVVENMVEGIVYHWPNSGKNSYRTVQSEAFRQAKKIRTHCKGKWVFFTLE